MAQRVSDLCDGVVPCRGAAGKTAQGHIQEALQISPVSPMAAGRISSLGRKEWEEAGSGWLPGSWDGG